MLYRLGLKQLPGSVFVEIGSYLGSSSCFLAAAASEIRGGTKVHCVDTWKNEGMTEGQRDTWSEFQTNTLRYLTIIVPHRGHSVKIAGNFNKKIDLLLFIELSYYINYLILYFFKLKTLNYAVPDYRQQKLFVK